MARDFFQLAGFAAEIAGNEDHLVLAEPILSIHNEFFVVRSSDWNIEKLPEYEHKFVTWLGTERLERIREGDLVWVAGRAFSAGLSSSSFLRKYALQISAWQIARKGIRWTTGSTRHFAELHLGISSQMEKAMSAYLFDPLEKSLGEADDMCKIYRDLDVPESSDRFVWLGIFFHEINRAHRDFRVTARLAVRSGFFASDEDFEGAVAKRLKWLKEARLSETHLIPAHATTHSFSEEGSLASRLAIYAQMFESSSTSTWAHFTELLVAHGAPEMRNNV